MVAPAHNDGLLSVGGASLILLVFPEKTIMPLNALPLDLLLSVYVPLKLQRESLYVDEELRLLLVFFHCLLRPLLCQNIHPFANHVLLVRAFF